MKRRILTLYLIATMACNSATTIHQDPPAPDKIPKDIAAYSASHPDYRLAVADAQDPMPVDDPRVARYANLLDVLSYASGESPESVATQTVEAVGAAREHKVTAVQFQSNLELLKYMSILYNRFSSAEAPSYHQAIAKTLLVVCPDCLLAFSH